MKPISFNLPDHVVDQIMADWSSLDNEPQDPFTLDMYMRDVVCQGLIINLMHFTSGPYWDYQDIDQIGIAGEGWCEGTVSIEGLLTHKDATDPKPWVIEHEEA